MNPTLKQLRDQRAEIDRAIEAEMARIKAVEVNGDFQAMISGLVTAEMKISGLGQGEIGSHLGIGQSAMSQILSGKISWSNVHLRRLGILFGKRFEISMGKEIKVVLVEDL